MADMSPNRTATADLRAAYAAQKGWRSKSDAGRSFWRKPGLSFR